MAAPYRRLKLGSWLLSLLEAVAWQASMRKVMLTVFKQNIDARAFYTKCSYHLDATSPTDDPSDEYRCVIMSKVSPTLLSQQRVAAPH